MVDPISGERLCVPWVDVSNYEYVEPITLEQASYLIWRFKEISAAPLTAMELSYDGDCNITNQTFVDISSFSNATPSPPSGLQAHPLQAGSVQFQDASFSTWSPEEADDIAQLPQSPISRICSTNTYRFATDATNGSVVGVILNGPSGTNRIYELYDGDKFDDAELLGYGVSMNTFACSTGIHLFDVAQISYGSFALDNDYAPRPNSFDPLTWWGTGVWYGGPEGLTPESVTVSTDIAGIPLVKAVWTADAAQTRFNAEGGSCGDKFYFQLPTALGVTFWSDDDFESAPNP